MSVLACRVLAVTALLAIAGLAVGVPIQASVAAVDGEVNEAPTPVITDGVLIVDGLDPDPAALSPRIPAAMKRGANRIVVGDALDGTDAVPSPSIIACFGSSTPLEVQAIAQRTIEAWAAELDLDGPAIEIDLYWLPFGSPRSLGAAGPGSFVQDPRLPDPGARYPVALATQLLGIDFSPRDPCDLARDPDILVLLNRTAGGDGSMWNLTDGEPSEGQIDLESVILHELGHGWGFIGSADEGPEGLGWPLDGGAPFVFDQTVAVCEHETPDGCPNLTSLAVGDTGPLTSARVWFDLGVGSSVELYAPEQWNRGSSLSHLDEGRYRNEQQLLTPFLDLGESVRTVDNASLAVLQRLGYGLTRPTSGIRSIRIEPGDQSFAIVTTVEELSDAPPPAQLDVELTGPDDELAVIRLETTQPTVTGLVNGVAYRVRVRPVNAAGVGPWVPADQAVTPQALPPFDDVADFLTVASRVAGVDLVVGHVRADQLVARARVIGAGPALIELFDENPATQHRMLLRLYRGVLGRQADVGGLRFWAAQIQNGLPDSLVARFFAASIEFAPAGELDDGQFVDAIYGRILRRPPDPGGRAFWQAQLDGGLDRGWIVLTLTESAEHRARVDQDVFFDSVGIKLLGRFASTDEQTTWSSLQSAAGRLAVLDNAVALAAANTSP